MYFPIDFAKQIDFYFCYSLDHRCGVSRYTMTSCGVSRIIVQASCTMASLGVLICILEGVDTPTGQVYLRRYINHSKL